MKIGFTGTQQGMSDRQKRQLAALLTSLKGTEFHHGDCIGADEEADGIAAQLGLRIVIHPPDNMSKRAFRTRWPNRVEREPLPYLERNHHIVDETEVLIAGPKSEQEELRSGTWATVRYARKLGRTIRILPR
jgi:hypothetical protein